MSRPPSLLLCASLAAALGAQCPPGARMPNDWVAAAATPPAGGPAEVRWQLGKAALAAGNAADAQRHLLAALELHPASPALLFDLVRSCGDDLDQFQLWCDRFVQAAADAEGRGRLDAAQRKLLPRGPAFDEALAQAQRLTTQRAQAIAELARFVQRHKAAPKPPNAARSVLVRWAAELMLLSAHHAPKPLAAVAGPVEAARAGFAAEHETVLQGLLRVLRQRPTPPAEGAAPATGAAADAAATLDRAVRAARIVLGLHRQAGFQDLQGPAPRDFADIAAAARALLAEVAAATPPRVWTIDELAQMEPAAATEFTLRHRRFDQPGVALSTSGKYRIETTCGHATLLAVAQTVELHHARLVAHYGQDPFTDRQGTVCIVPEHSDLETEGAPYWWAGGFQSGDRTTVRFAWGNQPALGRTLTHELTHRFDGVLRPFLGSWFGEGHAQWTAGHYARMRDAEFVDDHLDVHTVAHTDYKGYGARDQFEKLLRGDVADYRDNYFAGYSLYAFLRSFPPKEAPRYGEAMGRFERGARGGAKDPVGWFTQCFCDGKQGRPATFDAFLAEWQTFLRGCREWLDDRKTGNEWVARYGALAAGDRGGLVLDPPTWSWARDRAEPFFGQDHAAAATAVLHEAGDAEATAAAGLWSIAVDGWRLETARAVFAALERLQGGEAAPAFAALAAARHHGLAPARPAPHLAQLPMTNALLTALAARAAALAGTGAAVAAAALAREHRELASRCGLPAAPPSAHEPPGLPEHLAGQGLAETSVTGFDDRRVAGLWYATQDGDLHVGRERPRQGTGTVDRQARQRDAAVQTVAWIEPGAYVLRGRVHFTTSYVSGAILFGHGRRDRGLRLHFSAGDFRYAIGKTEQNEANDRLHLRLHGLWERDRWLPDSAPERSLELSREQPWFDYALHVRGPRVLVEVNGEAVMRYAVHDGAPIEGPAGFAMSMGAIRVQQPTVQRLGFGGTAAGNGLDLARQPLVPLEDLLLLPTHGIPRAANGTLLLWLPRAAEGGSGDGLQRALPTLASLLRATGEHPQTWQLVVPAEMPAAERAAVQDRLRDFEVPAMAVLEHTIGEPFTGHYPWVLFVDALGVLRAAAEVGDPKLHSKVQSWARLFRSR